VDLAKACSLLDLGLSEAKGNCLGFSKAEVGRAFRRQAAKCHPDSLRSQLVAGPQIETGHSGGSRTSAESFVLLQQAYELVLALID